MVQIEEDTWKSSIAPNPQKSGVYTLFCIYKVSGYDLKLGGPPLAPR